MKIMKFVSWEDRSTSSKSYFNASRFILSYQNCNCLSHCTRRNENQFLEYFQNLTEYDRPYGFTFVLKPNECWIVSQERVTLSVKSNSGQFKRKYVFLFQNVNLIPLNKLEITWNLANNIKFQVIGQVELGK